MQKALDGKVKRVAVSARLTDTPSCVTAEGPITLEMEKILAQGPDGEHVKSDRVLELNAEHPVFKAVQKAFEEGDTGKGAPVRNGSVRPGADHRGSAHRRPRSLHPSRLQVHGLAGGNRARYQITSCQQRRVILRTRLFTFRAILHRLERKAGDTYPLPPIQLLQVRALPRSGRQSCRCAGRPSHEPSS